MQKSGWQLGQYNAASFSGQLSPMYMAKVASSSWSVKKDIRFHLSVENLLFGCLELYSVEIWLWLVLMLLVFFLFVIGFCVGQWSKIWILVVIGKKTCALADQRKRSAGSDWSVSKNMDCGWSGYKIWALVGQWRKSGLQLKMLKDLCPNL
jgi:hypothetical protein